MHTSTQVLLIKRAEQENFWQSVTGSLEWGETHHEAALRELQEETGLTGFNLRSTGISRRFKILNAWKPRYHPNATYNIETLFYCLLEKPLDVVLNTEEHSEYQWVDIEKAQSQVYSWTNRLGIKSLM